MAIDFLKIGITPELAAKMERDRRFGIAPDLWAKVGRTLRPRDVLPVVGPPPRRPRAAPVVRLDRTP